MVMTELDTQALGILTQAGLPIDAAVCCLGHALEAIKIALTQAPPGWKLVQEKSLGDLALDSDRLDFIQGEFTDVRWSNSPIADSGDADVVLEITRQHMGEKRPRVLARTTNEDLRNAIDAAMTRDREASDD